MKVKFWGSRGSIPASTDQDQITYKIKYAVKTAVAQGLNFESNIDAFVHSLPFSIRSTYGHNTPCVEILGGSELIVCDAGSGIRDLGKFLVSTKDKTPRVVNLMMSHLHWDHIQGFPFFIPAYIQGYTIRIWGGHALLKQAFLAQQNKPFFPVLFEDMGANISFHELSEEQPINLGGIDITIKAQPHPGGSYGYCFQQNGQKVVYSTDIEHSEEIDQEQNQFKSFYHKADLLIIDGQFNLADHLYIKQNWGHSSNLIAIEIGVASAVNTLCLFHADHQLDDIQLDKFLLDSKRYLEIYKPESTMEITLAYDGLLWG